MKMPDINGGLKRFNEWWDVFILEAIKPLGMLSLGLGTLAIFSVQGLAISPVFVVSWAVVQALSIDGLFFVTWDRLFTQKVQWGNAVATFSLALIGTIMLLVAIAINAIIGFQVLWFIADSQQAMAKLGISPELFTAIRAALAGVVFVFISFVRARARANEESQVAIMPARAKTKKASISPVVTISESQPLAISEVASSHEEIVDGLKARPESRYNQIKLAIEKANQEGLKINLTAIAKETGAGYSTVKLYAPDIKKELGIE